MAGINYRLNRTGNRFENGIIRMATEEPEQFNDLLAMIWPFVQHRDFISSVAGYKPLYSIASEVVDEDLEAIANKQGLVFSNVLSWVARRIADERTGYSFTVNNGASEESIRYFFLFLKVARTTISIIDLLDGGRRERLRERLRCEPGETVVEAYRRSKGGNVSGPEAVADLLELLKEISQSDIEEWAAALPEEVEDVCETDEDLAEAV